MEFRFNSNGKPDIALQVVGASPALDILINSTGTTPTDTVAIQRADRDADEHRRWQAQRSIFVADESAKHYRS
ncbi:hypothetical protein [Nitrosomonas sp. Nm33]|uniref:hypothetical protein n=1 Tax=Nitrosomonas sp. Nm33 TaxID=133724 RepID=UPI00115FB0F3|nr:hypothetical protein [Nitrosomonas sp. Nm33]